MNTPCITCNGSGKFRVNRSWLGGVGSMATCNDCYGSGRAKPLVIVLRSSEAEKTAKEIIAKGGETVVTNLEVLAALFELIPHNDETVSFVLGDGTETDRKSAEYRHVHGDDLRK